MNIQFAIDFLKQPVEVRELCIALHNAIVTLRKAEPPDPDFAILGIKPPGIEQRVTTPITAEPTKPVRKCRKGMPRKKWSSAERQLLFEEFDKVGLPSGQHLIEVARLFHCSTIAIQSQYHGEYKQSRGIPSKRRSLDTTGSQGDSRTTGSTPPQPLP